jgi:polyribonucleotide nucleotidyltransferase
MATVCGASLALFDSGIKLKGAVAGVAMGLVKEGDDYAILTDIAGAEDHYGDMDFKVAGTRKGITALQMDIKIGGLTREILQQAMEQARRGRLFLLDKMDAVLDGPRTERSAYAPRIETVMIPTDKIRDLIGKGGATIRGIIEQTGAKIDVDDTGKVNVASCDAEGLKKALEMIGNLTAVPEIGKVYLGKVVRLAEFGAFVELFPGTDGLLHISEIAEHRVKEVKDELSEGDQIMVKVLAIEGNRIKLSRKALIREQKSKLGQAAPAAVEAEEVETGVAESPAAPAVAPTKPRHEFDERQPKSNQSTILIEGGDDFDEVEGEEIDEENEPNFNRVDGAPAPIAGQPAGAGRPKPADKNRRRRRRPGGGSGGGRG